MDLITARDPITTRVIVGMSGGVDSSVAALLLQQAGFQVEGLFMKNWEEDDGSEYCTAIADLQDAERVCERLGIRLHQANFAAEYWDNVFEHFLSEYKLGRTPNPDILCNKEIKFNVFAQYAKILGAEFIATGHYARLTDDQGELRLHKGLDNNKDQSYFLQSVPQAQFKNVLFPIGALDKSEVRALAKQHNLSTHAKKDSTGICFIGERRFKDFLKEYLPGIPGDIVSESGDIIGHHEGLMFHTLGQRQGLRIGGLKHATEEPWYVIDKDLDRNQLVVAQGNSNPALLSRSMTVANLNWIGHPPDFPCKINVKTRYRQPDQNCSIRVNKTGELFVEFDEPQRAVTPGQWACFYQSDICFGGGVITATDKFLTGGQST